MRGLTGIVPYFFAISLLVLNSCDSKPSVSRDKVQEAWDNYNNPAQLDAGSVVVFGDLPASGEALKLPWADTYWPSYLGGISLRWRNGIQAVFDLPRLTEAEVRRMNPQQLAALSPAEKYDIYMGRFDFPTVQAELMRTHPAVPQWYGLCHGWASAASNFDEPGAVTVRGASGIDVPFASGDVKALLAYAQGVVFVPVVRALGQRCEADFTTRPELRSTAACRDTNAGSFHLVLTNLVGRQGQIVIADLSRDAEVWNFPIYGYSSRELYSQTASPGAAPQAISEVIVETDVDFLGEIETPNVLPLGDSRPVAGQRVRYQYAVELDSLGRIVGGRWLSEERPDFLWVQEQSDFRGYYGAIGAIYQASRGQISGPGGLPQPALTPPPVPTPVPVPTLPPTPTPAPTPDLPPLAVSTPVAPAAPTAQPDQPIGPVLTQPVPAPAPATNQPNSPTTPDIPAGTSLAISCPPGTFRTISSAPFCSDGQRAYAPYTRAMFDACMRQMRFGCSDALWTNELYAGLRGADVCPVGAVWNDQYSACVEDNMVLGPFSVEFTTKCVDSGFGNMCFAMKMQSTYFSLVKLNR